MNSSVIENLIAALIALEMCYFWIYRSFLIKHYACMRRRANLSEDWGIVYFKSLGKLYKAGQLTCYKNCYKENAGHRKLKAPVSKISLEELHPIP